MKLLTAISITSLVLTIAVIGFLVVLFGEIENLKTEDPQFRDKPAQMLPPKVQSHRCQVLSHYMVSSLTNDASRYFANTWRDANCDEEFEGDEHLLDIESKANLVRSQVDELLYSYTDSSDARRFKDCLWWYKEYTESNILRSRITTYEPTEGRWRIDFTGDSCKGIASFSVNDLTGEVSYLGSSLDK